MVRSFTPSDSEEEVRQKKKHSRRRSYSRSPQREHSRKKKRHRHSRSMSPVPKRKIKEEPVTPPRDKHRKKEERFPVEDKEERHSRNREERRDNRYDRDRSNRQNKERSRDDRSEQQRERHHNDEKRRRERRQRGGNPFRSEENEMEYGQNVKKEEENKPKEQPNFEVSGKLTEDTNTYRGVVIKYNQPPEARKPKKRWRLYPFKGDEALPVLHIHRQSAYLLGRDRLVVDIPTDHPSCSKQHAVLQFRMVDFERDDGTTGRRIAPYLIDLDSSNGSYINNKKIEPQRYVELLEKDVIKFGFSSREYVVLHDKTDASELNEDSSPE